MGPDMVGQWLSGLVFRNRKYCRPSELELCDNAHVCQEISFFRNRR